MFCLFASEAGEGETREPGTKAREVILMPEATFFELVRRLAVHRDVREDMVLAITFKRSRDKGIDPRDALNGLARQWGFPGIARLRITVLPGKKK